MKITNLTVSYDGMPVIDRLNLEIGDGITCIMGESGLGKTTLLHTIAGLIKPDSGEIEGAPVRPAVMFQEDRLLPWFSALKNLETVCSDTGRALEMLRAVELEEASDKLPDELSGGMKRRVALARTLLFDSDMLILDEPFKGLDEALTGRIARLIREVKVPVIVATHAESDVELLGAKKIVLRKQDLNRESLSGDITPED
ncbi:MAG: ATP-binding cassette domain-containing protein [Lachnospiraceae bacterium]|nr:ATP-binding cassette domain-containing protein [Lachnospiraceae bacterium]